MGCLKCDSADITKCYSCVDDYYLDQNDVCRKCMIGC